MERLYARRTLRERRDGAASQEGSPGSSGGSSPAAAGGGPPCGGADAVVSMPARVVTMVLVLLTDMRKHVGALQLSIFITSITVAAVCGCKRRSAVNGQASTAVRFSRRERE